MCYLDLGTMDLSLAYHKLSHDSKYFCKVISKLWTQNNFVADTSTHMDRVNTICLYAIDGSTS